MEALYPNRGDVDFTTLKPRFIVKIKMVAPLLRSIALVQVRREDPDCAITDTKIRLTEFLARYNELYLDETASEDLISECVQWAMKKEVFGKNHLADGLPDEAQTISIKLI